MAITTGFVQRLTWLESGPTACIWLGSTPTSTDLFFIQVRASDSDADVNFKCSMVGLLFQAQASGRQVDIGHGASSSEVTSAGTPLCNVAATPLQLDAIEVTQAIQSLSQGVPLLAGKRTVVRLYLSWYSTPGISVQGQIAVRQGPGGPSVTVASANTATLDPAQAGSVGPKRNDATRSLNFLLPILQTVEGPLIISVAGLTNSATGAALTLGCETRPTVWFHRSPPLRVRILGMSYTQGMPAVTFTPAAIDFNLLVSWLGRAYPVAQVVSSQAVVTATAAAPFGCGDINAQVAAIRAVDMGTGGDTRTHYYGIVSDGGFFMRGCAAGIPATAAPETVASGPTGPSTWGWDTDGSYGDWYGGHELGHTFGRFHPGFCGESQDDLTNYPYDNGQLGSSDASFAGFDVGDPIVGMPMAALPATQWRDVMTYCSFQWLSAYTYLGVRRRLILENP